MRRGFAIRHPCLEYRALSSVGPSAAHANDSIHRDGISGGQISADAD
jgi:hypothetical protein